jgi:hypothetical protein
MTVWEGVLTYGVSPITVAGPWPILTAFPTSQTFKIVDPKSKTREVRCQYWSLA